MWNAAIDPSHKYVLKATTQFDRRWLTDDDKAKLVELADAPPPLAK